jgi:hypothetical protein
MPREGVVVGLVGIAGSIAILIAAVVLHRSPSSARGWLGVLMWPVGIVGLLASVGWLILGAYVDAHVR